MTQPSHQSHAKEYVYNSNIHSRSGQEQMFLEYPLYEEQ